MNKKGVIFDKDGTLFDTEWMYEEAWIQVGKQQGVPLDREFARRARGLSDPSVYELVQEMHPGADGVLLRKLSLEYADRIQQEQLPLKPGAVELLAYLKQKNYKIALASAAPMFRIEDHLNRAHIRSYFDALVAGDQVEKGKPYPDIFEKAAALIGLAPQECIVVEDAANGILAGARAGMFTVMIPDLEQPQPELKPYLNRCYKSLSALLDDMEKGEV